MFLRIYSSIKDAIIGILKQLYGNNDYSWNEEEVIHSYYSMID